MNSIGDRIRASAINRALVVLGDWWSMLLIREAFLGVRQFEQLQHRLGIPRQTLVKRLGELIANDILYKSLYQSSPPRHEYKLTTRGLDLYTYALMIWRWQNNWATRDLDQLPASLYHKTCGHPTTPCYTCAHCHEDVALGDVRHEPGSGAGVQWQAPARAKRWSSSRGYMAQISRSPHEHSLFVVADRWAHLILTAIFLGCKHFDSLGSVLQIAPNILSHRLELLTDSGLLSKFRADDDARRYVYLTTARGRDMFPVSMALLTWADRWLPGPEGPSTLRYHRHCGAPLDARASCSACHEELFPWTVGFSEQVPRTQKDQA